MNAISWDTYCNDILNKKKFYMPLFLFVTMAYGFSLFNHTIGYDDFLRDHYIGDGKVFLLGGRWGMVFLVNIMGVVEYVPFADRFLALLFHMLAAVLLGYIFYSIDRSKDVLRFTILVSSFVTFPIINEIWEYCGANFIVAFDLCLVTLAYIVLRSNKNRIIKQILSVLLLTIPMSSYESSIFYYVSLVSICIFYELYLRIDSKFCIKCWVRSNLYYFVPVILAYIVRCFVSLFFVYIYSEDTIQAGATEIYWLQGNLLMTFIGMVAHNIISYVIASLVYFPILIFLLSLFSFVALIINRKNCGILFFLGFIVILSLFSQSLLQGAKLPYRTAQPIILFVAFVLYIVAGTEKKRSVRYYFLYFVIFGICWHQAVYMNKILGLNNLRSENEVTIIHNIGARLISQYDRKPVVFVSPFETNEWINKQITVDENTWNGKLFYSVIDNILTIKRPYKFIDTNVNCATAEYPQIQNIFNYFGYNIDVIEPRPLPNRLQYNRSDRELLNEAIEVAKKTNMKKYQIYDNTSYIIVKLGDRYFQNGFYEF